MRRSIAIAVTGLWATVAAGAAATVIANMLHPDLRERTRRQGLIAGLFASILFFALETYASKTWTAQRSTAGKPRPSGVSTASA